jgi:hypothetical protein
MTLSNDRSQGNSLDFEQILRSSADGAAEGATAAFLNQLREVPRPAAQQEIVYRSVANPPHADIRVGSRGGVNIYCRDQFGEWDSSDGRTWIMRGTNGRYIWRGVVEIDGNRNYITNNSDTGVRFEQRPNGQTFSSMTDTEGNRIEVGKNRDGSGFHCRDRSGVWMSADGRNWTNRDNGNTWAGSVRIDRFGQYLTQAEGQAAESVTGRSRELSAIVDRQQRLAERYGIVFPRQGQEITYSGSTYTCRPPTNEELDCLTDVLRRNEQMNLRNMRFCFLEANAGPNSGLWGVYQSTGNEGSAQMLIMPRAATRIRGWDALEGTLLHELVHHEQHQNWGDDYWGAGASAEQTRQVLADLGWVYHADASGRARILDRDGVAYQRREVDGSSLWDPVIDGRPVPERALTNDQMRDRAQVRPSTGYFTYPWEMHAEALAMFRHDRPQLYAESRSLYELMKRYDQAEITRRFGSEDGQPRRIRGVNGDVVPNTPENRRAVEELEDSFRRRRFEPRADRPAYCRTDYVCAHCNM